MSAPCKTTIPSTGRMGCLRCDQCGVVPRTDFEALGLALLELEPSSIPTPGPQFEVWARAQDEAAAVTIFCGKVGHLRRARLWRACGEAVARPRWRLTAGGSKVLSGGNYSSDMRPFERAFLQVCFSGALKEALVLLHQRTWPSLLQAGKRAGLQRERSVVSRALRRRSSGARTGRIQAGIAFNDAQSDYILGRQKAGKAREPFEDLPEERVWPRKFSGVGPYQSDRRARNAEIKADIIEGVARLGPARTWDAIRRHPEYKRPGYQARTAERRLERREGIYRNNSLSRPQTRRQGTMQGAK